MVFCTKKSIWWRRVIQICVWIEKFCIFDICYWWEILTPNGLHTKIITGYLPYFADNWKLSKFWLKKGFINIQSLAELWCLIDENLWLPMDCTLKSSQVTSLILQTIEDWVSFGWVRSSVVFRWKYMKTRHLGWATQMFA